MAKKQSFDWFKLLPVGVLTVSFVSAFTMLKADASDAKDRIKALELQQSMVSKDTGQIQVTQARQEEKLNAIYEAIKDLKVKK